MRGPFHPLGPDMIGFLIFTALLAVASVALPALAFWLAVTA